MSSVRQRAQKDKAKLQQKARTPATATLMCPALVPHKLCTMPCHTTPTTPHPGRNLFGHTMHRGVGPDDCIFVADKGNHRIQDIT